MMYPVLKPRIFCLLLLASVGLIGCSTTPSQACLSADWYTQGATAGAAGLPITEVLKAQNACAPYGVSPDRSAFTQGWRKHQKAAV